MLPDVIFFSIYILLGLYTYLSTITFHREQNNEAKLNFGGSGSYCTGVVDRRQWFLLVLPQSDSESAGTG